MALMKKDSTTNPGTTTLRRDQAATAMAGVVRHLGGLPRRLGAAQAGKGTLYDRSSVMLQ